MSCFAADQGPPRPSRVNLRIQAWFAKLSIEIKVLESPVKTCFSANTIISKWETDCSAKEENFFEFKSVIFQPEWLKAVNRRNRGMKMCCQHSEAPFNLLLFRAAINWNHLWLLKILNWKLKESDVSFTYFLSFSLIGDFFTYSFIFALVYFETSYLFCLESLISSSS